MFLIVALVQFCSRVHIPPIQSRTISQRRFLSKSKVCPLSVSSTNTSTQNSKLENNALDNTSLLLMYRRYNICYFTANLVVLLHVFFFLIYLFLFVLHFQCIFWVLKMVLTICPCQLAQQDIVLIVCAHGTGQLFPVFEHCSKSSSRPRWYNNYIFWHSLQFVSGCCIIDIPATATSSLRAPRELPDSITRVSRRC